MRYIVLLCCLLFAVNVSAQDNKLENDTAQGKANEKVRVVVVRFLVTENGSIDSAYILEGIDSACNNEALRIIRKMHHFKPSKQRIWFTQPITFDLEDDTVHKTKNKKSSE